jgi:DNA-binding NarL/FixJ family response regulator
MTEAPIRVVVADDHAIVRTGIRHVLESEPGFEVVGEAATGPAAIELVTAQHP